MAKNWIAELFPADTPGKKDEDLKAIAEYIRRHEGESLSAYNDTSKNKTIGIGHKVKPEESLQTITKEEQESLFDKDVKEHIRRAKALFPKFDSYPLNVKQALADGAFRGDFEPDHKTVRYINTGQWEKVPTEYINRDDYRESKASEKYPIGDERRKTGIYKRLDENAKAFTQYVQESKATESNPSLLSKVSDAVIPKAEPSTVNKDILDLFPGEKPIDTSRPTVDIANLFAEQPADNKDEQVQKLVENRLNGVNQRIDSIKKELTPERINKEYSETLSFVGSGGTYQMSDEAKQTGTLREELYDLETAKRNYASIAENADNNFWQGLKKGASKSFSEAESVPFLSSIMKLEDFRRIRNVLMKQAKGEELTSRERASLEKAVSEQVIQMSLENKSKRRIGYNVGTLLVQMPAFMGEFGMTGGVYTGVKKAGMDMIGRGLVSKLIASGVAGVSQGLSDVPRLSAKTAEYLLPNYQATAGKDGELYLDIADKTADFKTALTKAVGTQSVEYLTERMGFLIEKPLRALKLGILGKFISKNSLKGKGLISRAISKLGWNGIIGEIFEEEIAEPLQAKIEGRNYYPVGTPEGNERLLTETIGIGAFGGISGIADTAFNKATRYRTVKETKGEVIDINPSDTKEKDIDKLLDANEEIIKKIETGERFSFSSPVQREKGFIPQEPETKKVKPVYRYKPQKAESFPILMQEGEEVKAQRAEDRLKNIAKESGAEFNGIQVTPQGEKALFNEPETKQTFSLGLDEVSAETVKAKVKDIRKEVLRKAPYGMAQWELVDNLIKRFPEMYQKDRGKFTKAIREKHREAVEKAFAEGKIKPDSKIARLHYRVYPELRAKYLPKPIKVASPTIKTIRQWVNAQGGLSRKKAESAGYPSSSFIAYGFRLKSEGGRGIDELAQEAMSEGLILPDETKNPSDILVEAIQQRQNTLEYEEYLADKAEYEKGEKPNKPEAKPIGKETDPLIQEAKKYKSAEEWIKAKGKPVYHGTNIDFEEIGTGKGVRQTMLSDKYEDRPAIFFSLKKSDAEFFAKNRAEYFEYKGMKGGKPRVIEAYLDIKNPADFTTPEKADKVLEKAGISYDEEVLGLEHIGTTVEDEIDSGRAKLSELAMILDEPRNIEKLKKAGYDGAVLLESEKYGLGKSYAVFDKSQIKTKSQLIQIWEQAQKGKGLTKGNKNVIEESRLPYTVQEGESDYYEKLQSSKRKDASPTRRKTRIQASPLKVKYKKKGYFYFPQEEIKSPADVAFAFQSLKNEAVERLYVIGVKNNKAVFIEPLSIGSISSASASTYETLGIFLSKKADSFYLVHNHPSGNPTPSDLDIRTSKSHQKIFSKHGIEFKGHIIINDTKFGLIKPSSGYAYSRPETEILTHQEGKPTSKVPYYSKYIEWYDSPDKLAVIKKPADCFAIIKGINTDWQNNAGVLYLNNSNKVLAIDILPKSSLLRKGYKGIAEDAILLRSTAVILVNSKLSQETLMLVKKTLSYDYGITLLDSVDITNETFSSAVDQGKFIGEKEQEYSKELTTARERLMSRIKNKPYQESIKETETHKRNILIEKITSLASRYKIEGINEVFAQNVEFLSRKKTGEVSPKGDKSLGAVKLSTGQTLNQLPVEELDKLHNAIKKHIEEAKTKSVPKEYSLVLTPELDKETAVRKNGGLWQSVQKIWFNTFGTGLNRLAWLGFGDKFGHWLTRDFLEADINKAEFDINIAELTERWVKALTSTPSTLVEGRYRTVTNLKDINARAWQWLEGELIKERESKNGEYTIYKDSINDARIALHKNQITVLEQARRVYDSILFWINQKRKEQGLEPIGKRDNYVTHIFHSFFDDFAKGGSLRASALPAELQINIDYIPAKGNYDPYLLKRYGLKVGLKKDFLQAFTSYAGYATKVLYNDPVRYANILIKHFKNKAIQEPDSPIDYPYILKNLEKYIKGHVGRPNELELMIREFKRNTAIKLGDMFGKNEEQKRKIANAFNKVGIDYITGLTYMLALGYRPRSATKNFFQHLVILNFVEPRYLFKALFGGRDAESLSALNASFVYNSRKVGFVPETELIERFGKKVKRSVFAMFRNVDRKNVKDAFLAGFYKAKAEGKSFIDAVKEGDRVASNSQWLYLRSNRSRIAQLGSVGRMAGIFTTWGANYLENLGAVAKSEETRNGLYRYLAGVTLVLMLGAVAGIDPKKFASYTGITTISDLFQRLTGATGLPTPRILLDALKGEPILLQDIKRAMKKKDAYKALMEIFFPMTK